MLTGSDAKHTYRAASVLNTAILITPFLPSTKGSKQQSAYTQALEQLHKLCQPEGLRKDSQGQRSHQMTKGRIT